MMMTMRVVDLVILIGWVLFWGYWLFSARNIKPGRGRGYRFVGIRVAVVIVVVFVLRSSGHGLHGLHQTTNGWGLGGIGLALWAVGLALAVWARLYLGGNWGTPMTRKEDPDLITTGPYRFVRHPIYSGIILAAVGTALATSIVGLVVVVVLGAYFIYSAVNEERYMAERFPDTYPSYRARSKMLIPFLF
jgi:protein-S-isoprenylcysteine O-methyltransferase Ste14